jgi:hypothetical protein
VDHQSRPGVPPKKSWRDRLIRLAQRHPEWLLGFEDEVWWSRLAFPVLRTWTDADHPLHLVEQTVANTKKSAADPDAARKAIACYGLLVRDYAPETPRPETMWLRFVAQRPVSGITTRFLAWCAEQAAARGKTALLLIWDNASWHVSQAVRTWVRAHNRRAKATGGVRVLVCPLPVKSPWLNPIEPKWVHGKRAVVEPARLLPLSELEDRVCAYYGCQQLPHLAITEQVA